ncbi:MAG: hypothetical protein QW251_05615 [Desulfurococcaceae archaeon]
MVIGVNYILGLKMCRLYAMAYRKPDHTTLKTFIEAFVESNRYDHYLASLAPDKSVASHDDGWGLVAVGLVDNTPTHAYYKTVEPIFHENSRRILELYTKKMASYDEVYIIVHARKASRREPYGPEYAHPYMMMSDSGIAWFAHNGGADKKLLAEKLGVYPWVRVDSELLGYYVMDNVLSCVGGEGSVDNCVVEAYLAAKHYVVKNSALNTALLVLHEDKPHLYITHWVREPKTQQHLKYFEMISLLSDAMTFGGSISIREYLPESYAEKLSSLEPGVYRLEPGSLKKLSDL